MAAQTNQALPAGYQLENYKIDKVISIGGFSCVYLARNRSGERFAIKEYLPHMLAARGEDFDVIIKAPECQENFNHGLKYFVEEGRALAKIDHDNIVRVTNFFRGNHTVYMVMRYERGISLQDYIQAHEEALSERFVRDLFDRLLTGLREVHTHKLLHLDIKPANIYIRLDGSPLLLDFGSARQTLVNLEPNMPPSFTPGFAPPEQYFDRTQLGPWSDIYSLGASMYACLLQAAPLAADMRVVKDHYVPATKAGQDIYSPELLQVIDQCLQLDPLKRPQSVFALQKALQQPYQEPSKKHSLFAKIQRKLKRQDQD